MPTSCARSTPKCRCCLGRGGGVVARATDRWTPVGMPSTSRADRVCFEGISIRLVTGCARVDAEAFLDGAASDTTLRARRDEWTAAGVFDALADEAIAAYDRIASLDFSEGAVDGSQLKAPTGGEGTGPNPTDRAKIGWKWSLFADRNGSRSDGRPTARTVTTRCCWHQPWRRYRHARCSPRSRHCTSTATTTTASSSNSSPGSGSPTSTARNVDPLAPPSLHRPGSPVRVRPLGPRRPCARESG